MVSKPGFFEKLWSSIKSIFGRSAPKEASGFRALTKKEKEKLGLKPTQRRFVRADLKRVTKKTKMVSERAVRELKLGKSIEQHVKETIKRNDKTHNTVYINVDPKSTRFKRLIKKAKGHKAQLIIFGQSEDGTYQDNEGPKFSATPGFSGDELDVFMDKLYTTGLMGYNEENKPFLVNVKIFDKRI